MPVPRPSGAGVQGPPLPPRTQARTMPDRPPLASPPPMRTKAKYLGTPYSRPPQIRNTKQSTIRMGTSFDGGSAGTIRLSPSAGGFRVLGQPDGTAPPPEEAPPPNGTAPPLLEGASYRDAVELLGILDETFLTLEAAAREPGGIPSDCEGIVTQGNLSAANELKRRVRNFVDSDPGTGRIQISVGELDHVATLMNCTDRLKEDKSKSVAGVAALVVGGALLLYFAA